MCAVDTGSAACKNACASIRFAATTASASCQRLVVAPVPNATIDDGQPYSVQINVINGSAPITAVPFALPDGAAWNAQNRTLVWARAVGRMRPYELVVRVSNELDSVTLSWFVTVRRTIAVGINVTQADRQRLPLAVGERLDLRVQTTPVTAGVVASIMAQSNGSDAWYELGAASTAPWCRLRRRRRRSASLCLRRRELATTPTRCHRTSD
jgi:hypothetical protein